ncbi:hypothetical protein SDC9_172580 [bioreactor metagenome]|uniref:Flagellin C-terminal domain-containing protein n=1 Tax=bioreactor metagenome TaxID=1076179 RepID=A0A645GN94_9ZZZZ
MCGSLGTAVSDLQGEIDGTTSYVDGKALLDAEENKGSSLYIGPTQTSQFAFSGTDLLGAGTNNVYFILDKCISMVKNGDTAGLSGMIGDLQSAQSRVLCFQTNIGATMNTMELIGSRYTSSTLNYKEMQSDAIDADMAEAYTNFTTAKTVYSAALAAGAEIVQISLLDFLK